MVSVRAFFANFFMHSTKRYLTVQIYNSFQSQTPEVRPKSTIYNYNTKRDDEHPCPFSFISI